MLHHLHQAGGDVQRLGYDDVAQTFSILSVVHRQPVDLEDSFRSRELEDDVLVPVDAESGEISQLVRHDESLAAGLRSFSSKEVNVSPLTVVGEVGDLDGPGVHHDHRLGGDAVLVSIYLGQSLVTRRLKTFSDVNISEVVLRCEIKD